MEKNTCCLCGSNDSTFIDTGLPTEKTGRNVICRVCGLIYHNPVMSEEEITEFYRQQYAGDYHDSTAMQLGEVTSRLNFLNKHIKSSKLSTVIEIGCARGDFLNQFKKTGAEVRGVEPSIELSSIARENGLDVFTGRYEDLPNSELKFDLVCMFHVLEHIRNPVTILRQIRSELNESGKLFVEVPTFGDCQLSTIFKKIHPVTFVKGTLLATLETAGFSPEVVEQQGNNLRVLASFCEPKPHFNYQGCDQIIDKTQRYLSMRQKVLDRIHCILEDLVPKKGIAIYGAGHNTLELLEIFDFQRLDLVGIFDADPAKQGKQLLGHEIQPAQNLREFEGSSIIISSYAYQEEIQEQLSYLGSSGVQLVKLYDKENFN
ncbi:MAG: methyltransferase domain-containing protein [Caldithrix sp.]|nr:MAG: methyltransferase domain-containing protein [Caldithrix sp.]